MVAHNYIIKNKLEDIAIDNNLILGDINELQCILDFQKRGYYCSIPFSGSCKYDVVADINGNLIRIQCKSSSYYQDEGVLKMNTSRTTTNTQKTTSYKYSKEEIDYFYTSWESYGFLIPIEEADTYQKFLRVLPPQNGMKSIISVAADYLLDNVIISIINNMPINKYINNRIISIDSQGKEKLWKQEELYSQYNDRQIRYIKEKIMKHEKAFGYEWKYKEFPSL